MSSSHARDGAHEAEREHEQKHTAQEIHPGHGHSHAPSKRQACPPGKAYYVCAIGAFKGCCSSDPCSTGLCADYPHDPNWKPSLVTATESVTETQTAIGSYTTTVTMTLSLSSVTATSTLAASGESRSIGTSVSEASGETGSTGASASEASGEPRGTGASAGEASSASEGPAVTPTSTHRNTGSASHTTSLGHASSSSAFLSIPLATSDPSPHSSTPHGGTIAGITLGLAGGIALLILLCCFCVRRRRRKNAVEDKELKQALKEAAAVQAERNKALRALENRRTGVGSEGAWAASPRFSTSFVGRREG